MGQVAHPQVAQAAAEQVVKLQEGVEALEVAARAEEAREATVQVVVMAAEGTAVAEARREAEDVGVQWVTAEAVVACP